MFSNLMLWDHFSGHSGPKTRAYLFVENYRNLKHWGDLEMKLTKKCYGQSPTGPTTCTRPAGPVVSWLMSLCGLPWDFLYCPTYLQNKLQSVLSCVQEAKQTVHYTSCFPKPPMVTSCCRLCVCASTLQWKSIFYVISMICLLPNILVLCIKTNGYNVFTNMWHITHNHLQTINELPHRPSCRCS